MGPEETTRLRSLLEEGIDWSLLEKKAIQHGLAQLLYKNVQSCCPDGIPDLILSRLAERYLANARRNLVLTSQLLKLLRLFNANQIPAIPFKGPVLAALAYGDLALREFSDLDILIKKEDVPKARALMTSSGFRLPFKWDEGPVVDQLSQYEMIFVHDRSKTMVELKWNILENFFSCPFDIDSLWRGQRTGFIADKEVPTLSPEDSLLILCVHGTKHLWDHLIWVSDVSQLIHTNRGLDWEYTMRQSASLGCQRILFLGLQLCKDLLGTSIPERVEKQASSDPIVKTLSVKARERLFSTTGLPPGPWESCLFHMKSRERLMDRIRYCYRLARTTTPGDREFLGLPAIFSPVFLLMRPFRLTRKYGLRVLSHVSSSKGAIERHSKIGISP